MGLGTGQEPQARRGQGGSRGVALRGHKGAPGAGFPTGDTQGAAGPVTKETRQAGAAPGGPGPAQPRSPRGGRTCPCPSTARARPRNSPPWPVPAAGARIVASPAAGRKRAGTPRAAVRMCGTAPAPPSLCRAGGACGGRCPHFARDVTRGAESGQGVPGKGRGCQAEGGGANTGRGCQERLWVLARAGGASRSGLNCCHYRLKE